MPPVPGCHLCYSNSTSCFSHVETHYKKYTCDLCGHQTSKKANLRLHVQLIHQKKSFDVKCTECDLIFYDHNRMLKHRNLIHFPEKYRCSVCQKSFASKTLMTRHMAVHDAEGQFECNVCGRKVKKLDALRYTVLLLISY